MGATVVLTGAEFPRLQMDWRSWPQLQVCQKPGSTAEIQLLTFHQQKLFYREAY